MLISTKQILNQGRALIVKSPQSGEGSNLLKYFQELLRHSSEYLNYPSDYYDHRTAEEQEKFISLFTAAPDSFALCAYLQDQVIGHLVLKNFGYPCATHAGHLAMGILNDHQGQGIGAVLLNSALEFSSQCGITHIELRVRQNNKRGIALYEKCGFVQIGEIPNAAMVNGGMVTEYLYVWDQES